MVPRKLIEERTCMKCEHYHEEWDGDYGTIFCGSHCNLNEKYGNLPSFPFKKKMPCFQINFWLSRFADLVDGEMDADKCRGLFYFKQADADGNLPPDLEKQFQEELAAHKHKHKDLYDELEELDKIARGTP